jgi:hypothetical protein
VRDWLKRTSLFGSFRKIVKTCLSNILALWPPFQEKLTSRWLSFLVLRCGATRERSMSLAVV